MTTDEKIKIAVELCRKRALEAEQPERACLELYADILPIVLAWEERPEIKDLKLNEYLSALVGVSVTLAAHGARNVSNDEPDVLNHLGPLVTANFAKLFRHECFHGEIAAIIGRLDS